MGLTGTNDIVENPLARHVLKARRNRIEAVRLVYTRREMTESVLQTRISTPQASPKVWVLIKAEVSDLISREGSSCEPIPCHCSNSMFSNNTILRIFTLFCTSS